MITTRRTKLGLVKSMDNLHQFALTDTELYNDMYDLIFTKHGKILQFERLLQDSGNITMTPVDDTSDFRFDIAGEVLTYTNVVRFEGNSVVGRYGEGGTEFILYLKDEIADRGAVIGGPKSGVRILLDKKLPESDGLYPYVCKMWSGAYCTAVDLQPTQEWDNQGAPSSREMSFDGPATPISGKLWRQHSFTDIRVHDTMGGELASKEVVVHTIDFGGPKGPNADTMGGESAKKQTFYILKQKLMDEYYYKVKQHALMYGEDSGRRGNEVVDSRTLEVLRESNGLATQQGQGSIVYSPLNIETLSQETTNRESRMGYIATSTSYTVTAGTAGFDLAIRQCTAEGAKVVQTNIEPGATGLTAGFMFSKIQIGGKLFTFVKDAKLDINPQYRERLTSGILSSSMEWHVLATGELENGEISLEYKYSKTKNDISRMNSGFRGQGAESFAATLMPTLENTALLPVTSMVDGMEMSKAGTFSILNKQPFHGFTMKLPIV